MMGDVSAGVVTFSFSPVPAIGIHTFNAQYSGDANNQGSSSGQQTTVLTGSTKIAVSATSGAINASATLPIILN